METERDSTRNSSLNSSSSDKTGQLHIHSENILPIIKKWLYSERDIFIRELASNGFDAIQKRKILETRKEIEVCDDREEDRIDITIDEKSNTITISDTGIGMTAEEAEKYLSQIAFSGAEEFMKAYQLNDAFIGHFGLGFFSSFMVSTHVEVKSLSCRPNSTAIVWSSDGSSSFSITHCNTARIKPGTDVILTLNEESKEYIEPSRLQECVRRFCQFFPVPVYVQGQRVNTQEPLWIKNPKDVSEEEYIQLYRALYPFQPEPLFWVHINVDYPFHVQGILYFPRMTAKDATLQKETVSLYSNRVFVSDNCKDVLPEYLTVMRGIIDSPDIPLNVSRSYLQVDRTVRQLSNHISKKVTDAIHTLYKTDRKKYESIWQGCELVVKLGMLEDDKFYDRVCDALIFSTVQKEYKTISELVLTSGCIKKIEEKEKSATLVYCDPGQDKSPLVSELVQRDIAVIMTTSMLDHPLMAKIEKRGLLGLALATPSSDNEGTSEETKIHFKRVDSEEVTTSLTDPHREKTVLDAEGKTEALRIQDFFTSALCKEASNLHVEAKSLHTDTLPAIFTLDEEERRFRDYTKRFQTAHEMPSQMFTPKAKLIINTNNPTIISIAQAATTHLDLAQEMAQYVVSLAQLSQNELSKEEMEKFIQQSTTLLEHVAKSYKQ